MNIEGMDISKFQTQNQPVDFTAVLDAGVEFVMVRAGWCGYEGEMNFDPDLAQIAADANDAGVHVGFYVYSYALSAQAARRAAEETIEYIRDFQVEYPIAFDVEDAKLAANLSAAQITATVQAFCEQVEQMGYYAMYYTYLSFARTHLKIGQLTAYDFWLADYTSSTGYEGEFGMWQYSGSGIVPGVSGKVDRDIAYKDYAEIIRNAGLNGFQKPKPKPEEKPSDPDPDTKPEPQPSPPDPAPDNSPGNGICAFFRRLLSRIGKFIRTIFSLF